MKSIRKLPFKQAYIFDKSSSPTVVDDLIDGCFKVCTAAPTNLYRIVQHVPYKVMTIQGQDNI